MTIRLDSPIYRGLTRVFDAALITVYWAVCSLPVVTAEWSWPPPPNVRKCGS